MQDTHILMPIWKYWTSIDELSFGVDAPWLSFYICPDNSEIFLIKGVDPQCGEGDGCPPTQVK